MFPSKRRRKYLWLLFKLRMVEVFQPKKYQQGLVEYNREINVALSGLYVYKPNGKLVTASVGIDMMVKGLIKRGIICEECWREQCDCKQS